MTISTIDALAGVTFSDPHPKAANRNLRALLEQVVPLVMGGTIQSIKDEVNGALAVPPDDSREYNLRLRLALQSSWPYVHWEASRGPFPAERKRLHELYRQMWDSNDDGVTPF